MASGLIVCKSKCSSFREVYASPVQNDRLNMTGVREVKDSAQGFLGAMKKKVQRIVGFFDALSRLPFIQKF